MTRRFDTGLALGHVLRGLEVTAKRGAIHRCACAAAAACRAAWAAAEAGIGSGADQSELIRWLETVAVQEPNEEG